MTENTDLIRIYTGTKITVNLLKKELEEIGITSHVQNDFNSGTMAGFGGGIPSAIDLYIQEVDLPKAEALIKEFLKTNG